MNYSTAKTILHLYRKKQKKSGKKIKEENRCLFKEMLPQTRNPIEVVVTQGGKQLKQSSPSFSIQSKSICKAKAAEHQTQSAEKQYHLKMLLTQCNVLQMKLNEQKKEIVPSQISQKAFETHPQVQNSKTFKRNIIIVKPIA